MFNSLLNKMLMLIKPVNSLLLVQKIKKTS